MLVVEQITVDRADAGDDPVGRGPLAQCLHVVALVLECDDQWPVLVERSRIHELGDVLADHAIAASASFGHSLGSVLVQVVGVAFAGLLQVLANVVEIELLHRFGVARVHLGFLDEHDRETLADDVAPHHGDGADAAVPIGCDDVLHLHRLDDGQLLAPSYLLIDLHIEGDDSALDRRAQSHRAVGSGGPGVARRFGE